MKYLLIVLLLLGACKKRGPSVPDEWLGIDPAKAVCSWPVNNYREINGPGTCIAEGRAYLCLYARGVGSAANRVSCAPAGAQLPAEHP